MLLHENVLTGLFPSIRQQLKIFFKKLVALILFFEGVQLIPRWRIGLPLVKLNVIERLRSPQSNGKCVFLIFSRGKKIVKMNVVKS